RVVLGVPAPGAYAGRVKSPAQKISERVKPVLRRRRAGITTHLLNQITDQLVLDFRPDRRRGKIEAKIVIGDQTFHGFRIVRCYLRKTLGCAVGALIASQRAARIFDQTAVSPAEVSLARASPTACNTILGR